MSLYLEVEGEASVSERHERVEEANTFRSEELVEGEYTNISLRFSLDEECPKGTCILNFSKHHMVNENTGRGFHSYIEVWLDKAALRRLATFIEIFLREIEE
jgi:hypothetical protein